MYIIRNTKKLKTLLEQDKRIFRTSDLAVLWGVSNKNTLLTTISRYVQKQILYTIQKGLYSTTQIDKLHKYELGCAIAGPLSYVSAETVLQNDGVIMQNIESITMFGKKAQEFTINQMTYKCRYLHIKYLLNRKGIDVQQYYSIATKERAVADILHINPNYYLDNDQAIDKKVLNTLVNEIGYQ